MNRDKYLQRVVATIQARQDAERAYEQALCEASDAGLSAYAIAKATGMTDSGVRFQLKKFGR